MANNLSKSNARPASASGSPKGKKGGGIVGDILKILFFLALLPTIVAMTVAFCREFQSLPHPYKWAFNWGLVTYLVVHILIYEPQGFYQFGQKIVSLIFRFFSPLVDVAPFFFPIYSILLLIAFYFEHLWIKSLKYELALIFFISFTLIMHLALTAKALREKDSGAVKPNYFFAMAVILVINIFLISILFDWIIPEFSFTVFFKNMAAIAREIYSGICEQLF